MKLKDKIFNQIYQLENEASRLPFGDEKDSLLQDIQELNDEYEALCKEDCVASGEHFSVTISEGGFDKCFNCGGKN